MKKETAYQRRGCSIFCKILRSLLLVLLAEVLLLIFAISTSRVTSQLNENAEDILDKQVENRATVFQLFRSTTTLYISYPISWILTALVHFICLMVVRKKLHAESAAMAA